MKIPVGSKVKFAGERTRYTVQASDERFAICTRPFTLRKTTFYTIIDFEEQVRGPEDLIFGMGAESVKQCEEMLDRLNGVERDREETLRICEEHGIHPPPIHHSEVSHRHRIPLDLVRVDEPLCLHCKKKRGEHKASTLQCPRGRRSRIGYIGFASTRFTLNLLPDSTNDDSPM